MELKVGDVFWMYIRNRSKESIGIYTRVLWENGLVCAYAYGLGADNYYQGAFSIEDLTDHLICADLFFSHLNTWGWPGRRFT